MLLEVWASAVVASLVVLVLFAGFATGVAVATVARSRRRAKRARDDLRELARWCPVGELADIDEALEEVLAQEDSGHRWPIPVELRTQDPLKLREKRPVRLRT
ncbi:MAG TPA: hypothetical protein VGS19_30070 [Streptosporangiaceae bacterium]|nr:hypothetical protein [Streptosporangiaceae bacterium]